MGDKRELLFTIVILVAGFLIAPVIIDHIPLIAILGTMAKTVLCFAISGVFFLVVIFVWAFFMWVFRQGGPG